VAQGISARVVAVVRFALPYCSSPLARVSRAACCSVVRVRLSRWYVLFVCARAFSTLPLSPIFNIFLDLVVLRSTTKRFLAALTNNIHTTRALALNHQTVSRSSYSRYAQMPLLISLSLFLSLSLSLSLSHKPQPISNVIRRSKYRPTRERFLPSSPRSIHITTLTHIATKSPPFDVLRCEPVIDTGIDLSLLL